MYVCLYVCRNCDWNESRDRKTFIGPHCTNVETGKLPTFYVHLKIVYLLCMYMCMYVKSENRLNVERENHLLAQIE